MAKMTLSVIKADIGGYPGHCSVHPKLIQKANEEMEKAVKAGTLTDFTVSACGDDLALIMTHEKGEDNSEIHEIAWNTFLAGTEVAKELKLYGAGQDLLKEGFTGNVKGMGPGCAEIEFEERKSEPLVVFLMDKTEPGAFNLPVFKIFGDPFTNAGLVVDPDAHMGFRFEVWDIEEHKKVILNCPEEMHDLLALIGAKSRYVIKRVLPKEEHKMDKNESLAAVSTDKLSQIAGKYVGKDDPVAVVRSQSGLPAFGEVLEPFAFPHLVSGWMRGSHNGPIMPCSVEDAHPSRFDGPPRVVGLGFQISKGRLIGPVDLFKDKSFDKARETANTVADYMRRHGPFEPHRLPLADMEYTTLPHVLKTLGPRFEDV